MKKVMIDHGSGAKIMYLNLYKGLGLKEEDFTKYNMPLVGFDGEFHSGSHFLYFSPYTAILA